MITLQQNAFLGAITNLIAYVETLDLFALDKLELNKVCKKRDTRYGSGKVIRSADIPTVTNMPTTSTLLSVVSPTVDEQYLPVSKMKTVQLTINDYLLRGAFLNEYELSDFTSELRKMMRAAKEAYIFSELVTLIDGYTPTNSEQTVSVTMFDTSSLLDPAQLQMALTYNTNALIKAMNKVRVKMKTPYDKFNDLSFTELVTPDEMNMIITDETESDIMVDTFAKLFNSDKLNKFTKFGEVVELPADLLTSLGNTFIGYLAHKDKFQYGYVFEVATSFFDGSTLNINNWLHFAYYIDIVKACPCIKFVKDASLTPAALQ